MQRHRQHFGTQDIGRRQTKQKTNTPHKAKMMNNTDYSKYPGFNPGARER